MKLSIVIPIYCVKHTLDRCVESVLAQDVLDAEVILVDDGSPDSCPQKCDEWAVRDRRISVIHQANMGLSGARNTGIEAAQGDYITFVDSDDYLEHNTLNALIATCYVHPEYDIVEYPAVLFEGSNRQQLLSFQDKAYHSSKDYWDGAKAYLHTYACNKVFKRKLFDDVRFPVGKKFEDVYTLPLLLQKASIIATSSSGLYHYCYNSQGITTTAGTTEWRMLLDAHLCIASNPMLQPLTDEYCIHLLNIQLYNNELTGDPPQIPDLHFHHLYSIKTILYQILGIRTLCLLNRIFRKIAKRHS